MELKGNVALVTGGGSGLGEGLVRALSQAGAKVAIFDLEGEQAKKVAETNKAVFIPCDVSDGKGVETAFQQLKEKLGIPRICVNCAGILSVGKVVGKDGKPLPLESFKKVVDINLVGTFNVLRVAAAEMSTLPAVGEERGVIINIASIAAFEGQVGQAGYSASKGGVVSMTLPVARELASLQIRVMGILPGIFETPMLKDLSAKARTSLLEGTMFPKRLGLPSEFADLALHIIKNPMLNGSVIRLDGAIRLSPK